MKIKNLLLGFACLLFWISSLLIAQSPADNQTGVSLIPTFTFAAPTSIDNEWIQISTNTGFTAPLFF